MFMRLRVDVFVFGKIWGGGALGIGGAGGIELVDMVFPFSKRTCDICWLLFMSEFVWAEFMAGGVVIEDVVVDIDWLFVEFESLPPKLFWL